jgi:cyclin H
MIHHPYWPLHGFFLDIQVYIEKNVEKKKEALQGLLTCYSTAANLVPKALMTDIVFQQSPSQIALACLWAATASEFSLKEYILWRFKGEDLL